MSRTTNSTSAGVNKTTGNKVKKSIAILGLIPLLCAVSCTQRHTPVLPGDGGEPQDTIPAPPKHEYNDVALHEAFVEHFSGETSETFEFFLKENDFRYYPAFPSWTEKGTDLLLLRVDPSDPAGLVQYPCVSTREHTFFGTYSIRLRLPDIKAVQPNIGLNAVFTLAEQDENNGYSTVEMLWKLADPSYLYLRSIADLKTSSFLEKDPVGNFDPSGKYYTYGFDWHRDKLSWWILDGSEKHIFAEISENVPCFPSRLQFKLYHSRNYPVEGNANAVQAPLFQYEFEIDSISYEPYEDEIQAWRDEFIITE